MILRPELATPTAKLRFIEREGKRILQQWVHVVNGESGWRDVPLETPDEVIKK